MLAWLASGCGLRDPQAVARGSKARLTRKARLGICLIGGIVASFRLNKIQHHIDLAELYQYSVNQTSNNLCYRPAYQFTEHWRYVKMVLTEPTYCILCKTTF